jgi:hypothetical protein
MAPITMIILGVFALIVLLLFGIVVELCRDVRQLRDALGILDRPLEVDIGDVAGSAPSSYGLPRPLDSAAAGIILFLSDRCATCHGLASGLAGTLPPGVWLVLEVQGLQAAEEFLGRYNMTRAPRLSVDVAGTIAGSIGLRTTPVAFRVSEGRITGATTVPSSRYLASITPTQIRLERSASLILKEEISI